MSAAQAFNKIVGFLAVLTSFVLCMICYFAGATDQLVPQADFIHIGPPSTADSFFAPSLIGFRNHSQSLNLINNNTASLTSTNATFKLSQPLPDPDYDRFFYIYLWRNCYGSIRTEVSTCSPFNPGWTYNLMLTVVDITPPQLHLESQALGVENELTAQFVYVTYTCVLALTGFAAVVQLGYSFAETSSLLLLLLVDIVFAFLFLFAANCGFTFIMNNAVSTINRLAKENKVNLLAHHGKLWLILTWVSAGLLLVCAIVIMFKKPWVKEETEEAPMEMPPV